MAETKIKPIKALVGYNKKSPTENLASANAVHSGIFSDTVDYPKPPMDEATFKGAIDMLAAKITAGFDGGKKAIAERNHQEAIVIKMMRQLAHYAEEACNDNMPTFLKSGFQAASTATGTKPSLSQFIRKIAPGQNSGQLHVTVVAVDGATAYEIRYAPTVNGQAGLWATKLVTKTRPAAAITGLTPGATYTIQVRSFTDESGFSDWSDPVTRICM